MPGQSLSGVCWGVTGVYRDSVGGHVFRPNAREVLLAGPKSVRTLAGRIQSLSGLCRGHDSPTERTWSAPSLGKVCLDSVGAYPEFIGTLSGTMFSDQTHLECARPGQGLSGLCRGAPRVYRAFVGAHVSYRTHLECSWPDQRLSGLCRRTHQEKKSIYI
jgi:hypothetical protein